MQLHPHMGGVTFCFILNACHTLVVYFSMTICPFRFQMRHDSYGMFHCLRFAIQVINAVRTDNKQNTANKKQQKYNTL